MTPFKDPLSKLLPPPAPLKQAAIDSSSHVWFESNSSNLVGYVGRGPIIKIFFIDDRLLLYFRHYRIIEHRTAIDTY